MSTIHYGGGAKDESSIYNMRGDSALGGGAKSQQSREVLNFPYMCDEGNNAEELQFADKIKMINNQQKASSKNASKPVVIQAASGDPLTTILIQTFVDMM